MNHSRLPKAVFSSYRYTQYMNTHTHTHTHDTHTHTHTQDTHTHTHLTHTHTHTDTHTHTHMTHTHTHTHTHKTHTHTHTHTHKTHTHTHTHTHTYWCIMRYLPRFVTPSHGSRSASVTPGTVLVLPGRWRGKINKNGSSNKTHFGAPSPGPFIQAKF